MKAHPFNRVAQRLYRWLLGCFLCSQVFLRTATFAADSFVIATPFGFADSPTGYAREPFALEELGVPSCRYQQVFGAVLFSSLGGQPAYISLIGFLSDPTFGRGFGANLPSVEILLGTTQRNPNELSTIFANNPDGTMSTVWAQGPLHIGAGGPGSGVNIMLQTSFLYDPADGNLLLEIRNYQRIPLPYESRIIPPVFDAWAITGDPISRVYAYDVNATTGTADTLGLTTYFGRYSLDTVAHTVTHAVEGANNPDWIGGKLVRSYRFMGPDRVELTVLTRSDGTRVTNPTVLVWERVGR